MQRSFYSSQEIESYHLGRVNAEVPPMCYLYNSSSVSVLQEMVSKLVFVCLLQELECVAPEDEATLTLASDVERAQELAAGYVSFVCVANPCFESSDFERLYEAVMDYYMAHWRSFAEEFANQFELWKDGWSGCLFIR